MVFFILENETYCFETLNLNKMIKLIWEAFYMATKYRKCVERSMIKIGELSWLCRNYTVDNLFKKIIQLFLKLIKRVFKKIDRINHKLPFQRLMSF